MLDMNMNMVVDLTVIYILSCFLIYLSFIALQSFFLAEVSPLIQVTINCGFKEGNRRIHLW